jgi:hypothetical protein
VKGFLDGMKGDIERLVAGLPSHAKYMVELERYLAQNKR